MADPRTLFLKGRDKIFSIALYFLGSLILIFVLLPLGKLILENDPSLILKTAAQKEVIDSIKLTFTSALWATFLTCLSGIPLSYILARKDFAGKSIISSIIDLPIVIPHSSAGIALLLVFGRRYIGGKIFAPLGIQFAGAVPGIVVAMMFVSFPFLVNQVREGFSSIDPKIENAARLLGASPWRTFFFISLPLASKSILAGMIMMWARGISEFGAVIILAYYPMVAPVLVYERFESYGLAYAKPIATVLVILSLIIFVLFRALFWRSKNDKG